MVKFSSRASPEVSASGVSYHSIDCPTDQCTNRDGFTEQFRTSESALAPLWAGVIVLTNAHANHLHTLPPAVKTSQDIKVTFSHTHTHKKNENERQSVTVTQSVRQSDSDCSPREITHVTCHMLQLVTCTRHSIFSAAGFTGFTGIIAVKRVFKFVCRTDRTSVLASSFSAIPLV